MRLPLPVSIASRDGSSDKDERLVNCLGEKEDEQIFAAVRPGLTEVADTTGSGKGLVDWNGQLIAMYGTTVYSASGSEDEETFTITTGPGGFLDGARGVFASPTLCLVRDTVCATTTDGYSWTSGSMPSFPSTLWYGLCWDGSKFLAVSANNNKVATSVNGLSWTVTGTLPATMYWLDVAWNGTVFCAIGEGPSGQSSPTTVAATSIDGITWTQRTMPASRLWTRILWNGSVFCALAQSSSTCATSSDGITWTSGSIPAGFQVSLNNEIAWNGSVFCIVDYFSSNSAAISANGLSWTEIALPDVSDDPVWSDIVWNGSAFYCFGFDNSTGEGNVVKSANGSAWTIVTPLNAPLYWFSVAFGSSIYIGADDVDLSTVMSSGFSLTSLGTVSGTFFDFTQSTT